MNSPQEECETISFVVTQCGDSCEIECSYLKDSRLLHGPFKMVCFEPPRMEYITIGAFDRGLKTGLWTKTRVDVSNDCGTKRAQNTMGLIYENGSIPIYAKETCYPEVAATTFYKHLRHIPIFEGGLSNTHVDDYVFLFGIGTECIHPIGYNQKRGDVVFARFVDLDKDEYDDLDGESEEQQV